MYIYGLYLDGAGWDRRGCKLIEPQPKVLFTLLPVVHVYAVNSTAPKDSRLYQCPVYKKPQRTDLTYITPLWLKTVLSPDHWILRGVALLCDIKWLESDVIFHFHFFFYFCATLDLNLGTLSLVYYWTSSFRLRFWSNVMTLNFLLIW